MAELPSPSSTQNDTPGPSFRAASPVNEDILKIPSDGWPSQGQDFAWSLMALQICCLLFFIFKFDVADPSTAKEGASVGRLRDYYAMYMDIHVMIFIGFGFLMTFLRKYSFSAVSLNFMVAILAVQWGIITVSIAHEIAEDKGATTTIDVAALINGDFAAAAVLITFGAVIGKITPTQLVWMTFFELIFYAVNEAILTTSLSVVDPGGSMIIHAFGAFFGLALTIQLGVPTADEQVHNTSQYNSDIFAMIGTVFLWMYWPSFNAAMLPVDGFQQERAVVNTVLSISASCAAAFAATKLLSHSKKFDMVHIQNATLAGGVAMGTSCGFAFNPAISVFIGLLAGVTSVVGYCYATPFLERTLRLSDTCGIFNLHAMPSLIGGFAGAVITAGVSDNTYGDNLTSMYSARAYRSAAEQAGYQALGTVVSVAIGLVSGHLVGVFLKSPRIFRQQKLKYDDEEWFHVPEDFRASVV